MHDLFSDFRPKVEEIYPETFVLPHFTDSKVLKPLVNTIVRSAPFRHMMTPMGYYTNVALTNCGSWGWHSDITGYRYVKQDPQTQRNWPAIPPKFMQLAKNAAQTVGFANFEPDACLINCYQIGSQLGSHQDKNEQDFKWPIVSVSIGLPATFQIFGKIRSGSPINYQLLDGDVMVWGGKSRLIYHGVKKLQADKLNPKTQQRINITFRKAR